jgi:hypothetical protein
LKKPKDSQKVIKVYQELIKEFCKYEVSKKRLRRPNRPKFKRPNPLEVAELIRLYKVLKKYLYALKEGQTKCYH